MSIKNKVSGNFGSFIYVFACTFTFMVIASCSPISSLSINEDTMERGTYSALIIDKSDNPEMFAEALRRSFQANQMEVHLISLGNNEALMFRWRSASGRLSGSANFATSRVTLGFFGTFSEQHDLYSTVEILRDTLSRMSEQIDIVVFSEYIQGGCETHPDFDLSIECYNPDMELDEFTDRRNELKSIIMQDAKPGI